MAESTALNNIGSDSVTSGDLESQNNAAAWTSRHHEGSISASTRDSKRNDAAHLAQELATATSWSETFLPQSYGTVPDAGRAPGREGHSQQPLNPASTPREDFDPPPAYSKRPQASQVQRYPVDTLAQTIPSSSTMQIPSQHSDSDDDVPADLQQDIDASDPLNVEEPLLDRCQRRRRCRRSKRQRLRDWAHRGKDKKRKCIRLMVVLAVCSIFSLTIVFLTQAIFGEGNTWFRRPKSSQTLVPTGPDYRYFDPTGNIKGLYKLYDRLELRSATGAIDIEIDPQPGVEPAYLIVSSDVGSITIRVSPEYLARRGRARRPIYTEIKTLTGSISADILLGNGGFAFVDSTLGSQVLNVLAYDVYSHGQTSNITTESTTGAQIINLQSMDGSFITDVHARHHTAATGSLEITYPSTWLGEVHVMSTVLGRAILEGNNLDFTKEDDNEVIAHRGTPTGRQRVEVISDGTGTASFKC